jgi:hypothetical protein
MRASKNTIYASDVTTLPIKVKYTSSYDCENIGDYGITLRHGINNIINTYTRSEQETIDYRTIRHLYYSNYLSGSFPTTASAYDNWMQSTAASGTIEADQRYFPTNSGAQIKIFSIPRTSFGENVSPRSFYLGLSGSYNIYDDGNGNLRDVGTGSLSRYVRSLYYESPDRYYETLLQFPEVANATHVGNILYSQGIVVVTNPEYQDLFPTPPKANDFSVTFLLTDSVFDIDVISNVTSLYCNLSTASLTLSGSNVGDYTNNGDGTITLDTSTVAGNYDIYYKINTTCGVGCERYASNTAKITVNLLTSYFITTEGDDALTTETSDKLITEPV